MEEALMTVEELAELLRVSKRAVYSMLGRGELPAVLRIGKRVRFSRHEIAKWLENARK